MRMRTLPLGLLALLLAPLLGWGLSVASADGAPAPVPKPVETQMVWLELSGLT